MVDEDDRRIDLSALEPPDPSRTDRVVRAAMARIEARALRASLLLEVATWWRPGLAAAAAAVLFAAGLLVLRSASSPEAAETASVEARVIDWAESGHVPTNEELLSAFQGYSR